MKNSFFITLRPLFALRVDNFSGREWALPVAPVGRGPGAKRIKRKVRWTFLPLSGFAREGEPRLSSKARTAKRRKVRVKKAMDGLFQQPVRSLISQSEVKGAV